MTYQLYRTSTDEIYQVFELEGDLLLKVFPYTTDAEDYSKVKSLIDSSDSSVTYPTADPNTVYSWKDIPLPNETVLPIETENRNTKLKASDWVVLSDVTMAADKLAEWKTYRQALRDITKHSKWPHLKDSDWPTEPS